MKSVPQNLWKTGNYRYGIAITIFFAIFQNGNSINMMTNVIYK